MTTGVRAGIRVTIPVVAAFVPFALVVGAAVAASDQPLAAWASTFTIYGGAAQLAVLDLLTGGSGWVAAAMVGLVVNARLGAYATAMAPAWRTASLRSRLLAGAMLTDVPWGLTRARGGDRSFYLGAAGTLFLCWPALVGVGALVHAATTAIPVTDLLPALSLGAVVAQQATAGPARAAVLAGGGAALLTHTLGPGVSLLIAAVCGVLAGAGRSRVSRPEPFDRALVVRPGLRAA